MSKRETTQRLAAASSAASLQHFKQNLEGYRTERSESATALASVIEPLIEGMGLLTQETEVMVSDLHRAIDREVELAGERITRMEHAIHSLTSASADLRQAAMRPIPPPLAPRQWPWILLTFLLAPAIVVATLTSAMWLGGPKLTEWEQQALRHGLFVYQQYHRMTPQQQQLHLDLLNNPGGQ